MEYKYNKFSIELAQESLDAILAKILPESNWEVKFCRERLAIALKKEEDIRTGELRVFFRRRSDNLYTLREPQDLENYSINESWEIPKSVEKKVFDKDQFCTTGDNPFKRSSQSVYYTYIPKEHMIEQIPYITGSHVSYDGGRLQEAETSKEGTLVIEFNKLKETFTLNKFE